MTLQEFGEELLDFILEEHTADEFYFDCFLNYLGVSVKGSKEEAVKKVVDTCLEEGTGNFKAMGFKEKLSQSNAAMVNCFSSAIFAYDDIHFPTTTHPCGPVASVILAIAQKQKVSSQEAMNALLTGMETECRIGETVFSKESNSASYWYTTGIAGVIGAVAAGSKLYHFNREQVKSVLALAACYASGVRGSHGSDTGSFVPAIAAKNAMMALNLVNHGFTCSYNALMGDNGLLAQLAKTPVLKKYNKLISREVQCKMYPFGFIAYAPVTACLHIQVKDIHNIKIIVSPRVASLAKEIPQNRNEAFVAVKYNVVKALLNAQDIFIPLSENFTVSKEILAYIKKCEIMVDESYNDQQAKVIVNDEYESYCDTLHVMDHNEMIAKFKLLTNLDDAFIQELKHQEDLYEYLKNSLY